MYARAGVFCTVCLPSPAFLPESGKTAGAGAAFSGAAALKCPGRQMFFGAPVADVRQKCPANPRLAPPRICCKRRSKGFPPPRRRKARPGSRLLRGGNVRAFRRGPVCCFVQLQKERRPVLEKGQVSVLYKNSFVLTGAPPPARWQHLL